VRKTREVPGLLKSTRQAVEIQRGLLKPARVTRRLVTAKDVQTSPAPRFSDKAIRSLRIRMRLSQPVFADLLNVSAETVKSWEQGKNFPSGAAARLLQVAEKHPEIVARTAGAKMKKAG
jgi:DNA-binding transcriptional regulator YiaG